MCYTLNMSRYTKHFSNNRELVIARDNYQCVTCSITREQHLEKYLHDLTVDHIVSSGPWDSNSKTPNDSLENLQTLCLSCHGKKDIQRRHNKDGMRKLTKKDLREIRKMLANGMKGVEVARVFNVTPMTISYVKNKKIKVYTQKET